MKRSILLLSLFALTAQTCAGAGGNADAEQYTEKPVYQLRPDPARERFFG